MIKAVRGTRDLLPPETALWNFVESTVRDVFRAYNFQEIRTPIFESTELFARGVGEETDIVSKEMFTWDDGERFNEKKIIDEWLRANQSTDPTQVQAGRVNVQSTPSFLRRLKEFGIEFQVWRGIEARPGVLGGRIEFVAFGPRISSDTITGLMKARSLAKSDFSQEFGAHAILLRLVVPAEVAKSSPWVEIEDVEIEGFPGNYFSSSQSLTLRPEATAGIVRAYIEHNLGDRGLNKLYCIGPMFRRERPQKGRYRQFYQIDAEIIGPASAGSESPARDAEVLEMLATLLDRLGIKGWTLELNSVGCSNDRAAFDEALRKALEPVVGNMCVDCQRRAVTNPLRVFDCKVPADQPIIDTLPRISQFLDEPCRAHFAAVKEILTKVGVPFTLNDRLVRGLDYYTRTAFEFTHGALGAQNAILGGGRYDGLSEALGGPAAPGIGFAIGEDRLVMSLQESTPAESVRKKPDVYIAPLGAGMNAEAARLTRELRRHLVVADLGDETFRLKKSFETATKAGAKYILIVGENEIKADAFALKNLATGEQVSVPHGDLVRRIQE
ncbi:MAG TPA: histidine--tRNA ligase [Candidatus Deferrimicrobiaceae bacterium]|nr:histidine--tRNA ligase [Candidatus Deferrimicrobiaceae bacterium]